MVPSLEGEGGEAVVRREQEILRTQSSARGSLSPREGNTVCSISSALLPLLGSTSSAIFCKFKLLPSAGLEGIGCEVPLHVLGWMPGNEGFIRRVSERFLSRGSRSVRED